MVGLSTNSRFEGATEQKFFEAPYIVIEEKDLILGNKERKPGFIFKQVHVLSLDSLGWSNDKFMGIFLLGNVTC